MAAGREFTKGDEFTFELAAAELVTLEFVDLDSLFLDSVSSSASLSSFSYVVVVVIVVTVRLPDDAFDDALLFDDAEGFELLSEYVVRLSFLCDVSSLLDAAADEAGLLLMIFSDTDDTSSEVS